MMSDFRSDYSFPVKTGSCPTAIVDPSFDAEYPTHPSIVEVLRPVKPDILMNILGTCIHCQLPVLSPENQSKSQTDNLEQSEMLKSFWLTNNFQRSERLKEFLSTDHLERSERLK